MLKHSSLEEEKDDSVSHETETKTVVETTKIERRRRHRKARRRRVALYVGGGVLTLLTAMAFAKFIITAHVDAVIVGNIMPLMGATEKTETRATAAADRAERAAHAAKQSELGAAKSALESVNNLYAVLEAAREARQHALSGYDALIKARAQADSASLSSRRAEVLAKQAGEAYVGAKKALDESAAAEERVKKLDTTADAERDKVLSTIQDMRKKNEDLVKKVEKIQKDVQLSRTLPYFNGK